MADHCLATKIWKKCAPGADLLSAQGRYDLDRLLRAELEMIDDAGLRGHVGAGLMKIRARAFESAEDRHMVPGVIVRLEYLEARCAWLEAQVKALAGIEAPKPEPAQPVEIHSIRGKGEKE